MEVHEDMVAEHSRVPSQRPGAAADTDLPRIEEYPTRKDRICQVLRERILTGKLPPGERLVEHDLAARFGVSKTPVREALLTLEAEGLVTVQPHRGAEVAGFSLEEYRELQFVRDALEFGALDVIVATITDEALDRAEEHVAEMAAAFEANDYWRYRRAQRELHRVTLSAPGYPMLVKLALELQDRMNRYAWLNLAGQRAWWAESLEVSRQRITLLRRRDPAALKALLRQWHARVVDNISQVVAPQAGTASDGAIGTERRE